MDLDRRDALNLLDALDEWMDTCGPKELDADDVGLDSDRYDELVRRLKDETNG